MVIDTSFEPVRILTVGIPAYFGTVLLLRISGKRSLSKWNSFDFVVTIALGSVLATTVVSKQVPLAEGLFAFGVLLVLQYAITWLSVRSDTIRDWFKAEPTLLLRQGEFMDSALRSQRVTESEVRAAVRAAGYLSLEPVAAVVLETDGSFSVIGQAEGGSFNALSDVPDAVSAMQAVADQTPRG
jgi:uncharacterized membrane protein YcaP (DUF421 family)